MKHTTALVVYPILVLGCNPNQMPLHCIIEMLIATLGIRYPLPYYLIPRAFRSYTDEAPLATLVLVLVLTLRFVILGNNSEPLVPNVIMSNNTVLL